MVANLLDRDFPGAFIPNGGPRRRSAKLEPLIVDEFAGGGGASLGIEIALGRSPHIAINHDEAAIEMHTANHPDTFHYTEDVFHVDPVEACKGHPVRLLWASPDCFQAGTLVMTPNGLRPIERIQVGDLVLTHRNRWMPVDAAWSHEEDCVSVRGHGHYGLVTTNNHQFYSKHVTQRQPNRKKPNGKRVGPIKTLVENPYWPKASQMKGKLWATPHTFPESAIPTCSGAEFSDDFFYFLGRWLGDGSLNKGDVEICDGRESFPAMHGIFASRPLKRANGEIVEPRVVERDTTLVLAWGNASLAAWLRDNFGDSCETKRLPLWCLSMPRRWKFWLLEGYKAADGSKSGPSSTSSVSKALSIGIRLLVNSLGHAAALYLQPGRTGQIDGRTIVGKDSYRVDWIETNQKQTTHRDSLHTFSSVKEVTPVGRQLVYSLQVAVDESFVADGIVVHNCTQFSRAKGGKPVKKNIRALAWVVVRWAEAVQPPVIFLENVREFQDWCPCIPLVKHGRKQYEVDKKTGKRKLKWVPDPKRKGQTFRKWWNQLQKLGYVLERKVLNAADYGVPTSRKRLFIIARCDGNPIVWPKQTHCKPDKNGCVPKGMKPWRAAAECITWSHECPSIFDPAARKAAGLKPELAEKTMRRIAMGIMRYVLQNPKPFIVQTNHGGNEFRGQPTDDPLSTVSAKHGFGVVDPFIARCAHGDKDASGKERWGDSSHSIADPLPTQTSSNDFAVVAPTLVSGYGERPAEYMHICTKRGKLKRKAQMVSTSRAKCRRCGKQPRLYRPAQPPRANTLESPLPTVVGDSKHAMAAAMLTHYYGQSIGQLPSDPAPTATSNGHTGVAAAILKNYGGVVGTPMEHPTSTITAKDHHSLVTAAIVGVGGRAGCSPPTSMDAPLGTVTAKGDKAVIAAALVGTGGAGYSAKPKSVEDPKNAVMPNDRTALAAASIVKIRGDSPGANANDPLPTITSGAGAARPAGAAHALGLQATSLVRIGQHGGNGEYVSSPEAPLSTICSKNEHCVTAATLAKFYGTNHSNSVAEPLGTVTADGKKFGVVTAAMVRNNHGKKQANGVHEPLPTVTTQTNKMSLVYCLLVKYFGTAFATPVDEPLHTVTGKHRFGLLQVTLETGEQSPAVGVYVQDVGWCIIADIGLRMLQPRELARAQGFPDDYILPKVKSQAVAKIGNSVPPPLVARIVEANIGKRKRRRKAA